MLEAVLIVLNIILVIVKIIEGIEKIRAIRKENPRKESLKESPDETVKK